MVVKSNTLPRSFNLKSRVEIARLLREGKRYSGNYFTMAYEPAEEFKYGIFLSKRHGSAVARNRIKRLFREAVRLEIRPHMDSGLFAILPGIFDEKIKADVIRSDVRRVLDNFCSDQ